MKNNRMRQRMKPQPQMDPRLTLWEDDRLDLEPVPMGKALRFSPTAWARLLYFRDKSSNKAGGFVISAPDDLLFVEEFVTVKQEVSCVSVRFDDGRMSAEEVTGQEGGGQAPSSRGDARPVAICIYDQIILAPYANFRVRDPRDQGRRCRGLRRLQTRQTMCDQSHTGGPAPLAEEAT